MAGGYDYKEFMKLARETEKFASDFIGWLSDFLLTEALRALRLVRPLTPVNTGTLRRMWSISAVEFQNGTLVVYLINIMEYASFMEEGFTIHTKDGDRWWEGIHMAEISVTQVMEALPPRFNSQFTMWLKQYGWS